MSIPGSQVDAIVVGAGMAGLYQLYRLRKDGFSAVVLEGGADVGGTWYWNRYPGARCDIESLDYCYTFDQELEQTWTWSERYATQPEILRYLQTVADRHDLRRDIRFSTRVKRAAFDDAAGLWRVETDAGDALHAKWLIMATGCLSAPKSPDIPGADRFKGDVYTTGLWPHDGVDVTGKRVAVIGTGSSAIQSIPLIAKQARSLTVFQRTPAYSAPAHNGPIRPEKRAQIEGRGDEYREAARWSGAGVPREPVLTSALQVSEAERTSIYEAMWGSGDLLSIGGAFSDTLINRDANETLCEFMRGKIRSIVKDPQTAEALCPYDYPIATKRPCLDTGYYETFNLDHVRLVDLRKTPIRAITDDGIDTSAEHMTFDVIVFATGFDAMTGAILAVDIKGRNGVALKERWAHGPETYLGLMSVDFPNLFMVTGPGSPSVLSNMAVSIEQHVDWISDTLIDLRAAGFDTIEPTRTAQEGWRQHMDDCSSLSLFREAKSWYTGANVIGKPRGVLPYVGGVDVYRRTCNQARARGYLGFDLKGADGRHQCNDGVVFRLMPDVDAVLQMTAALGGPPLESLTPAQVRAVVDAANTMRPTGPAVGDIIDGALPGPAGHLAYRLYRPPSPGPHRVVVYFHGGGWLFGSHTSDDPLCRDLCVRADSVIVSVDYRHAPEHRFPAAHEDALAAIKWVSANLGGLGGKTGGLLVAGWSAGGNLAASVCHQVRDSGEVRILGQVLLTPVVDFGFTTRSFTENGSGYDLTASLMRWFVDNYVDPADRADPRCALLRADVRNLPPALIVTAEFDPLRDEGSAYAEALTRAGGDATHVSARGQIHSSITMVDVVLSGAQYRAKMADAIRRFGAAADLVGD
jgi:cation diffusion facilitator CzcD-associated flavoprotein CzcO/acetyl esterase/lipase